MRSPIPPRTLAACVLASLLATPLLAQTAVMTVKDASGTELARVNADGGFVVRGTDGTGMIPTSGAGTRLMWHPAKSAFRVGYVDGTQWDDGNVGSYSVAMGLRTTASGPNSTAMGSETTAIGIVSTALGYQTTARGKYSLVTGQNNVGYVGTLFEVGNGSSSSLSNALTLSFGGHLTVSGSVIAPLVGSSSDARLKEQVAPIPDALTGVLALRPVTYRFREGTNRPTERAIGLIAQEVQAVFPELVRTDTDGYLSVAYGNLAPILARAVQQQQAQIEALEARLARLEARLATGAPPARPAAVGTPRTPSGQ